MLILEDRKAVILNLANPGRVTTVIPGAKEFIFQGSKLVAVKHGVDESIVLRNLGFNVSSPIRYQYSWPRDKFSVPEPFVAQKVTSEFLTLHNNAFVLSEPGCGKTLSALWALDYLREQGKVAKTLIVATLSTLNVVWAREIATHLPHLNVAVLHGPKVKRVQLLKQDADVYIINHDGLCVLSKELAARKDINIVIVDEIASFRNQKTNRWKALNNITSNVPRVWGLTGTPTPNAPTDAYGQAKLISPHRVPKYYGAFRDKVMRQCGPFKWIPRDEATAIVHDAMQPAIRFTRNEMVDLPEVMYQSREAPLSPEQRRMYAQMLRDLTTSYGSDTISAANEAVAASKLLQIACISVTTPVLCGRGWVPIQDVLPEDVLWDGEEWVSHGGVILKGRSKTISCGGVRLTSDHLVLSTSGWVTAKEMNDGNASKKLSWAEVRVPASYPQRRVYAGKDEMCPVVVPVRLRKRGYPCEPIFKGETQNPSSELWLPSRERNPQAVTYTPIQYVGKNEGQMFEPHRQGQEKLWGSWRYDLLHVGAIIQGFLGRYARRVCTWINDRPYRQQSWVQQRQLSVGYGGTTSQQQTGKRNIANTCWGNDLGPSCKALWAVAGNIARTYQKIQMGFRASANNTSKEVLVYDILNAGPRNRFVVRGVTGALRIVHNCGVVYGTAAGSHTLVPCTERIALVREVIEQSPAKVIVFAPFRSVVDMLAAELSKDYQVGKIHGDTSKTVRDGIFTQFQGNPKGIRVIVAHPGTMAHGLNLTAADTVLWYAPAYSNEIYEQANARIIRPGQKRKQLIIHIESTEMERRVYKRLRNRQRLQGLLLDLVAGGFT